MLYANQVPWRAPLLGWLLFSGKKHDLFPEADELVAILYDGVYDVLEGDEFAVEDEPEVNVPTTTHDQ